jgi:hypothetical protein
MCLGLEKNGTITQQRTSPASPIEAGAEKPEFPAHGMGPGLADRGVKP